LVEPPDGREADPETDRSELVEALRSSAGELELGLSRIEELREAGRAVEGLVATVVAGLSDDDE
jgi:hypothetical protein